MCLEQSMVVCAICGMFVNETKTELVSSVKEGKG